MTTAVSDSGFRLIAFRAPIAAMLLAASHTSAFAQSLSGKFESLSTSLGNPDLAFVLLLIGVYGIILEIAHPGTLLAGLIGVICLVLATFALWTLPVQYGALALLVAGIALMTAEALTPGFGVLGLLGFAAFVTGGYFLFDAPAGTAPVHVSLPLIVGSAAASAGLIFFVLGAAVKARKRPTVTGAEQLLAARGTVIDWSGDSGRVRIHGEVWAARGKPGYQPGDGVKVESRDGLTLLVKPE